MTEVESWRGNAWFPSPEQAILVDRTGDLSRRLAALAGPAPERDSAERVQSLALNFVNAVLFGAGVLARGEDARALEVLAMVHRYLLWMARLTERSTEHWPTPARRLEQDVTPAAYARYVGCTAALKHQALRAAYRASWNWGLEMMGPLLARHHLPALNTLLEPLGRHLEALFGKPRLP
jgi:lincosamide nucleotidyltransferase